MSTKISISLRINKDIKKQLEKKAEHMGTTMSNIFNMYAHKFVHTGELEYLEESECETERDSLSVNEKIAQHYKKKRMD